MSSARHSVTRCKNSDLCLAVAAPYLISIAGSAGAFADLGELLSMLPRDLPAALAVGLHTGPGSVLVELLRSRSRLPVTWAVSGAVLNAAHVHVAPPGTHLVINPDARLTVSQAARIQHFRPSANWLFESGAASFGDRHVAIVLSGMLSDGALTLRRVKRQGGIVLVQTPHTCRYSAMPRAAIATGAVDAVLGIAEMGEMLSRIFSQRERQRDLAAWEDPFGLTGIAS